VQDMLENKIVKTARNKAESAESNSSSSALKLEGRKFDRFALFRMVCNCFIGVDKSSPGSACMLSVPEE